MSVQEPTITRKPSGHVTVEWPDPPRPTYQVSHEVIEQWVTDQNELANLRRWKTEAMEINGQLYLVVEEIEKIASCPLGYSRVEHALRVIRGIVAEMQTDDE